MAENNAYVRRILWLDDLRHDLIAERGSGVPLTPAGNYVSWFPGVFATDTNRSYRARLGAEQNNTGPSDFFLAVRNNNVQLVDRYLKTGTNPNSTNANGWTALHLAAQHDCYESLISLINTPGINGYAENWLGTALKVACINKCRLKTIKAILEAFPDIANYCCKLGKTPLHVASLEGNAELIELLLQYGAEIDLQESEFKCTALHLAVSRHKYEAVSTLLYAGADHTIATTPEYERLGDTAFHIACSLNVTLVKILYPFIVDINIQSCEGDTGLHYAAKWKKKEVLKFLLDHGADTEIKNHKGQKPIHLVYPNLDMLKIILQGSKAKPNNSTLIKACNRTGFRFNFLKTLMYSDLGTDCYNEVTPFDIHISRYWPISFPKRYLSHAPLNLFLYISDLLYLKKPERFREFFYIFLMHGVHVNPILATECPPLVFAQFIYRNKPPAVFKEVFKLLLEHGCDVDSNVDCSIRQIPDSFLAALWLNPASAPIIIPYSLYIDPARFLFFAGRLNKLRGISVQTQTELWSMFDEDSEPRSLENYIPKLKHLCRYIIRARFRRVIKYRNGSVRKVTMKDYIKAINLLNIPQPLKYYLRYAGNGISYSHRLL